jgi:hypothetical protein
MTGYKAGKVVSLVGLLGCTQVVELCNSDSDTRTPQSLSSLRARLKQPESRHCVIYRKFLISLCHSLGLEMASWQVRTLATFLVFVFLSLFQCKLSQSSVSRCVGSFFCFYRVAASAVLVPVSICKSMVRPPAASQLSATWPREVGRRRVCVRANRAGDKL